MIKLQLELCDVKVWNYDLNNFNFAIGTIIGVGSNFEVERPFYAFWEISVLLVKFPKMAKSVHKVLSYYTFSCLKQCRGLPVSYATKEHPFALVVE